MKDANTKKASPKPNRIKTTGGPWSVFRMEGGLEPLPEIRMPTGVYELVSQGGANVYRWTPGPV